MSADKLLIVADSERDANMLYAVGMFVSDPFIYLYDGEHAHIVLGDLEVGRARRRARHCRVLSWSQCRRKLGRQRGKNDGFAPVIRLLAREVGVRKFLVPVNFPYGLARELRRLKLRVKVRPGPFFFPEREFKTPAEVKKISAALMMAEVGMAEGIHAVRNSKIGAGGQLLYHGVPLTSEKLRAIINIAILQAGGTANRTIAAGGLQTCDPHEVGHGPLHAGQPIVLDIFPRSQKTGYYGDITRTVVKGRASEAVRKLYNTVQRGQELGFDLVRAGAKGGQVHAAIQGFFEGKGYPTGRQNGRLQGFFHGTGHGLGLELHEPPRISAATDSVLQSGHVITVEPGLYYPSIGGVRLEDVALVTEDAPRNLTKFEKVLEV
ncbi:MAG: Xaa-Pro peptidase family protein [Verrucomicrobiota bacterium]|jgi:Xaa-Pro aminopeptidase